MERESNNFKNIIGIYESSSPTTLYSSYFILALDVKIAPISLLLLTFLPLDSLIESIYLYFAFVFVRFIFINFHFTPLSFATT